MSYWDLSSIGSKLAGLMAMCGVVGGGFCLLSLSMGEGPLLRRILGYVSLAAAVGLLATLLFFFIQVGAINQDGLTGMWDWQIAGILLEAELGRASVSRLFGFLAALALVLLFWNWTSPVTQSRARTVLVMVVYATSVVLFALSFPMTGHVATLQPLSKTALAIHVLAVFLWIGSLYPLRLVCLSTSRERMKQTMERFGRLALAIVALLLGSGLYLLTHVLDSWGAMTSTPYGRSLLLKLALVAGLLSLAALNKLFLVPRLERDAGATRLRRSITIETALALLVLTVTAYFTTVTSP